MDEEDDDYVCYGTPLPDIEDEATLKKKAAKELQVRDEKGRQRFHGAFTGGFSAGYFNTVGTKEGWAPSTFVSSRTKNAECFQQNPEDFMDDEDFGAFGIATRKIHTTSNFQDKPDTSARKRSFVDTDAVIPGEAPLKDIVQPVRESIGIQILRKLGWKLGQGIGPRVKKQQSGPKVYGCSALPDAVETEEEDATAMLFTFAPKDTESLYYKPKDDCFGLGYTGLSKESVLSARIDLFTPTSTKSFLAKDKKKLSISGQAFGVGAFEDDDDDIYSKDDMSQYDFSDVALDKSKDTLNAIEPKRPGKSDDLIEGFRLSSKPLKDKKKYPPPTLPPNYKPIHLKSFSHPIQSTNVEKSRHALSASDRSLLLGEKKFTKPKSNDVSNFSVESITKSEQSPSRPSSSSVNFRPFPNDPSKQSRYEEYLKLKEAGEVRKLVQPSAMTEWEKQQEIEEFSKAAILFKPLANILSSRFESKSHLSVEHEVMAELEKIKKEKEKQTSALVKKKLIGTSNRKTFEWHPVSLLCKRMNIPNPYPNDSSSGVQSVIKSSTVFDHLSFTDEKSHVSKKDITPSAASTLSLENKVAEEVPKNLTLPTQVVNIPPSVSQTKKPPIDLFKDIFGSSSSEESSEDEKSEEPERKSPDKDTLPKKHNDAVSLPASSETNKFSDDKNLDLRSDSRNPNSLTKKVGFGVFANLDLDALNQRKPVDKPAVQMSLHSENGESENCVKNLNNNQASHEKNSTNNNEGSGSTLNIVDEWTPELPPNFRISASPASSDVEIVSSHLKKPKSKHKHKHKHHKHKSKKKKKKKSSKKESSDSESSDELEDVPPMLIIEKLKKLQRKNN